MKSYKNIFIQFFLVLIMLIVYLVYPIQNIFFVITNFIIITISIWGMFSDENKYFSLKKIYFIFNFYVFGFIAYLEIYNHVSYWGVNFLTINDYIFSNIIVILASIVFIFSYYISYNMKKHKIFLNRLLIANARFKRLILKKLWLLNLFLLILYFIVAIFIILLIREDWIRLFIRSGPAFGGQILSLIFCYFLKPLPIILFMILYSVNCIYTVCSFKKKVLLSLVFISSLILMFPTSTARFLAVALYLSSGLFLFKFFQKKYFLQFSSLLGVFIIFPFLDKFRHFNSNNFDWKGNFLFLYSGNFDAYQNLTVVLTKDIVTYGHQLLGSLFFYIPRSIWIGKPIGSGSFIAHLLGLNFDNISMPFIGEGFINFSIIGVIIFMFLLGHISAFLDKLYWNLKEKGEFHFYYIFYYLCLGLLLFLLRGDLLSGFAYIFTILMTFIFIIKFINISVKLRIIT